MLIACANYGEKRKLKHLSDAAKAADCLSGPYFGSKASFSALLEARDAADFCLIGACWYIAPIAKQTSNAPVPAASARSTAIQFCIGSKVLQRVHKELAAIENNSICLE